MIDKARAKMGPIKNDLFYMPRPTTRSSSMGMPKFVEFAPPEDYDEALEVLQRNAEAAQRN